jgi:DNA-binding SARP family transcriptional activator
MGSRNELITGVWMQVRVPVAVPRELEMGTMIVLAGSPPVHGTDPTAIVVDVALVHPPQACLVLAFLVLERHRRVPRSEIADLLWDDHRPPTWDAALRGLTGRIRRFLGQQGIRSAALLVEHGYYELRLPGEAEVDLEQAELSLELAARALENGSPRAALGHARRGETVFAAPLLPGVEHPWLQARRTRNRDDLGRALELASAARTALGQHGGAVAAAAEAHRQLPLRESALRALMAASSAAGNRADALDAFHHGRQRMRRLLGVEPSAATHELFLQILREDDGGGPAVAMRVAPCPRGPATVLAAADAELRALRRQVNADRGASPSREQARDLIRLCLLARRFGTAAEAEAACAEAVGIARILDDGGLLAEAALANATFDRIGPPARITGLDLVEEALAGLDDAGDGALGSCRAALLCRQVQYLAGAHQGSAAALVATELADSVVEGSPVGLRAWSLAARLQAGGAAGGGGSPRDLRAAAGLELFELARGTDAELALLGLEQRAAAIAESGDLDGAYAVMAAYARLAEREGTPWGLFRVVVHGCFRAAAEGRFDECEHLAGELGRHGAPLAPPWVIEAFKAAALYVPRWLTANAGQLIAPFRHLAEHLQGVQTQAPLAFLAAETDADVDVARAALDRALASWHEGGTDASRAWGLTAFNLTGAAARLGDQDAAARLYNDLLPVADDTCVYDGLIYLGSYQLHLGRLALACGWWEVAAVHLQTALDRHRRARATPWVALAADGLADALDEGGRRVPSVRTTALRDEALDLAGRVGMRLPASVALRGAAMQACV